MTHADIAAEKKERPLEEYGIEELIFTRADYSRIYSDYYYLVTGHTPTFRIDVEYDGKIYQKNRHIALDCGCIYGSLWACTALIQENAFTVQRTEEKSEDSSGKILRKMAKCF